MDERARRRAETRRYWKEWFKPVWPTPFLMALAILTTLIFVVTLFYAEGMGQGREALLGASLAGLGLMLIAVLPGLVNGALVEKSKTLQTIANSLLYMMVGAWAGIGIYLVFTP